jgi:hypothetical protein
MDDLTCLGCDKTFSSQKRLSSHETQCAEQRTLKKSLDKARRHLDKKKRRKTHHEEPMDVRDETPANDMQVSLLYVYGSY